jgi:hypothetical protein
LRSLNKNALEHKPFYFVKSLNFAVEPTVYVDETAKLGWTKYAEIINGRFAMIGFVSLLAIEVSIKHDVIGWLGNL